MQKVSTFQTPELCKDIYTNLLNCIVMMLRCIIGILAMGVALVCTGLVGMLPHEQKIASMHVDSKEINKTGDTIYVLQTNLGNLQVPAADYNFYEIEKNYSVDLNANGKEYDFTCVGSLL